MGCPAAALHQAGSPLCFDGLRVVPLKRDFRFATTSFELRVTGCAFNDFSDHLLFFLVLLP